MTAQVWRVDRTLLHKPAWNCHVDCADVVMLADYEALRRDAERYRWLRTQLEMFGTYDCGFRAPGDVDEACDWGTSHSVRSAHEGQP